ncbi:MAG: hypothetical protein WC661_19745 [Opitutaceae bacterium]|jgi:hypothetical protein
MLIPPKAAFTRKSASFFSRSLAVTAGCAGLALTSGCMFVGGSSDGGPNQVWVLKETPPPHKVVVEKGGSPPTASVIDVNGSTPPPKTEVMGKQPSPKHVWMAGNWRFYSGRYVWIKGRWSLPPEPNAVYTPPLWEIVNGNSMFTEGYWHF